MSGETTTGSFDAVRARHEVSPIRGCPGRYIVRGAATTAPVQLAGGAGVATRHVGRARDPVHVVALAGGGLISYEHPDGSYVHTLCDDDGFARKLAQLGIPRPAAAAEPDRQA